MSDSEDVSWRDGPVSADMKQLRTALESDGLWPKELCALIALYARPQHIYYTSEFDSHVYLHRWDMEVDHVSERLFAVAPRACTVHVLASRGGGPNGVDRAMIYLICGPRMLRFDPTEVSWERRRIAGAAPPSPNLPSTGGRGFGGLGLGGCRYRKRKHYQLTTDSDGYMKWVCSVPLEPCPTCPGVQLLPGLMPAAHSSFGADTIFALPAGHAHCYALPLTPAFDAEVKHLAATDKPSLPFPTPSASSSSGQ
jgi:hypothetical protein